MAPRVIQGGFCGSEPRTTNCPHRPLTSLVLRARRPTRASTTPTSATVLRRQAPEETSAAISLFICSSSFALIGYKSLRCQWPEQRAVSLKQPAPEPLHARPLKAHQNPSCARHDCPAGWQPPDMPSHGACTLSREIGSWRPRRNRDQLVPVVPEETSDRKPGKPTSTPSCPRPTLHRRCYRKERPYTVVNYWAGAAAPPVGRHAL
jgi:hypothetical protein